jgi:hypothetical protein
MFWQYIHRVEINPNEPAIFCLFVMFNGGGGSPSKHTFYMETYLEIYQRFIEFHRHTSLEYYIMILYYWISGGCGV